MNSLRRVLFYSDAPEYGGHEAMSAQAAQYLSRMGGVAVSFVYYRGNARFSERLANIRSASGNLDLIPVAIRPRSLQTIRSLVFRGSVQYTSRVMKRWNPDTVIVSQGRIESGCVGLLAAKRAGFHTISYIPMAHPVGISGKPFAVGFRDLLNKRLYRLPDKFVTISAGTGKMLRASGVESQIDIVPNGIAGIETQKAHRDRFRAEHGIGNGEFVVTIIGRVEFRQKGQDFVVQSVARFRQQLKDFRFLFIGEGPDMIRLKEMIKNLGVDDVAQVISWTSAPTRFYSASDLILIPSRFEGVPLVMLEAMSCKLPLVASNVDGMAETLPESWLFESGSSSSLIEALLCVRNADNSAQVEHNFNLVSTENCLASFGARFAEAVLS
jgi:glycosyltransferase involved in cell wall biosynthesis